MYKLIVSLITVTCLWSAVVVVGKKEKEKGGDSNAIEFISPDGEIQVDAFFDAMFDCEGLEGDSAPVKKIFEALSKQCEFSKKLDKPYELACALSCMLKKVGIISKENKFPTEEDKLKKVIDMAKVVKDEELKKKLIKEMVTCGKTAGGFNEKNCYSALPYAACLAAGARRVCKI